jgi:hypothetical protein
MSRGRSNLNLRAEEALPPAWVSDDVVCEAAAVHHPDGGARARNSRLPGVRAVRLTKTNAG